ncbi:alpha/beta fold hydrolase [Lewinella sp. JB7]|uniref:alpha/beta fold hydrolase n=1 Tax=Lewinella sp. JB7 TaxID=2962887 RepID=UPI0020C97B4A|nr:alpha/beta hydrolase [Lewinella sp. JB7]MCP9237839.1 alpha/beta hydrolase [Lewinella sp. JB7]
MLVSQNAPSTIYLPLSYRPPVLLVHCLLFLISSAGLFAQSTDRTGEVWYNFTDDGHRQFVYAVGTEDRDTVVVLHGGWGAEHSYLVSPLEPLFAERYFVFYDQRGSLRSPAPDSTITIDRLVEDLDDLRQALGVDRLTLLAHSMGTQLAYAYLARYPERVKGLVLVGAVLPGISGSIPDSAFLAEVWPGMERQQRADAVNDFFTSMHERAITELREEGFVPDSLTERPARQVINRLLQDLTDREYTRAWRIFFTAINSCNASSWREMEGGMAFYEQSVANAILADSLYTERLAAAWPALQTFGGPVRILMGTCDYVDPDAAVWRRLANRLRNGKLTIIPSAGHGAWIGNATAFQLAVREALDSL